MTLVSKIIIAAVCLLALVACASLDLVSWRQAALALAVAPALFGAVTVTEITAPSGIRPYSTLKVFQVAATADGDVAATLTHNFALTAAQQPNTEITCLLLQSPIAAASPNWSISARGANTATATKNATAGTGLVGVQVEFRCRIPHTLNS